VILGPVEVGKTFLATALRHIAVRRGRSVHLERADTLFKRLKAARCLRPDCLTIVGSCSATVFAERIG